MQQQLFSSDNQIKIKSLAITKTGKQKLSKNQEAFNRLTKKIEKLQKDIEKKQLQLDLALEIFANEWYPAQLNLVKERYKLILVLWGIYKGNKLSKPDQRHLKNIVQHHLQQYFNQADNEPDKALQDIFTEVEGISYNKMMEQEREKEMQHMQQVFKKMKVDIKHTDFTDEAAIAMKVEEAKQKMAEIKEKNEEREKTRRRNKNKTPKQVEYEKMQQAVEELKQKNISTIYKQLAKLFHPDLEQDTDRKLEKEILMKSLIAAYQAKDLHALLMLELKWIHKETDHLETLTEEKLAIYLHILKEQAASLEEEKYGVFQQPQYAMLLNQFGFSIQGLPELAVQQEVKRTKRHVKDFENNIKNLESETALSHVKELIHQWKIQDKKMEEEDILKMFFGR